MEQPGGRSPAPPELKLAQNLANTVDIERAADALRDVRDLATFAEAHGLAGLSFWPDDVARCLAFREALRDACRAHAGTEVPVSSAGLLDDALRHAPVVLAIDRGGDVAIVPAPNLSGVDALIAHIAAGIATAVANGTWRRLKACTASECRWVFYDSSPAGRGRWCTMKICGSRDKMRRWRQRRAQA